MLSLSKSNSLPVYHTTSLPHYHLPHCQSTTPPVYYTSHYQSTTQPHVQSLALPRYPPTTQLANHNTTSHYHTHTPSVTTLLCYYELRYQPPPQHHTTATPHYSAPTRNSATTPPTALQSRTSHYSHLFHQPLHRVRVWSVCQWRWCFWFIFNTSCLVDAHVSFVFCA